MNVERFNSPTIMTPLGSYCQAIRRGLFVAVAGVAAVSDTYLRAHGTSIKLLCCLLL